MSLQSALNDAMEQVPDCVAAGFVDVSTGLLLAVKTVGSHPQEVLDLVAAATGDLFQGKNVVAIENIFKQRRGKKADNNHYFQDIVVWSENLIHVFLRAKSNQNHVAVFVCKGSGNVGLILSKSRLSLPSIEAEI